MTRPDPADDAWAAAREYVEMMIAAVDLFRFRSDRPWRVWSPIAEAREGRIQEWPCAACTGHSWRRVERH